MWIFPPRRILCPIDFGDASAAAVRVAGALAQYVQGGVTLLHAESLDAPPYFTAEQIAMLEAERVVARRRAEEFVLGFGRAATNGIHVAVVLDGPPSTMILREAAAHDLVVMGTHGRRGASRWWLGSVAERVVRESPVPVLVVRAGSAPTGASVFARIVSIGDGTGVGADYAEQLAHTFAGTVLMASAANTADAVREAAATLVVTAMPGMGQESALQRVAGFVRTCERPVLFVPRRNVAES